jgi:sporulation integral membrane protein YtvI
MPEQKRRKAFLARIGIAVVLLPGLRQTALVAFWAALLAGGLHVPVAALARRGVRRSLGAGIVLLVFVGICGALLLACVSQGCKSVSNVLENGVAIDGIGLQLQPLLRQLPEEMQPLAAQLVDGLTQEETVLQEQATVWVAEQGAALVGQVPGLLFAAMMALLLAYYALVEWEQVKTSLQVLLPEDWRRGMADLWHHLKTGAVGWLTVQGKLMALQFVILAAGLALLGEKHVLWIAGGIAALDALPLLGCGLVLLPWAVVRLLEGQAGGALGLVVLWAVLCLSRTVLEPRLMGERAGVSPVWTLLAVYLGVNCFGFWGLIAAPILLSAAAEWVRSKQGPPQSRQKTEPQ